MSDIKPKHVVWRTAPKRIWLNVFGLEEDYEEGFPSDHEGITWCEDEVGDLDTPYIRADLAAPDLLPLLKEAHGVLDSVQWGFGHTRCPICTGWNVGPNGETDYAHTPTCPLALNLARLDATIRDMEVNHKTSL